MYDVIVSGYISLDRVIKLREPMKVGKTSLVQNHEHLHPEYGGCGMNFAVDLTQLGMVSCPIIRVGYDYESSGLKTYLKEKQIPDDTVYQNQEVGTSCSYLIEDEQTNHVTLYYPGAMDESLIIPYQQSWFDQAKVAVMTVASKKDNEQFLSCAKKANLPIYLGMKLDKVAFPKSFLKILLQNVSGIFANEEEYAYLLEANDVTSYDSLFNQHTQLSFIVITKGSKGSFVYYRNENRIFKHDIPTLKTDQFQSSVGGGDAFMAGFMFGYLAKETIEKCMYLGATAATYAIEGKGATSNAPSKDALYQRCYQAFNI